MSRPDARVPEPRAAEPPAPEPPALPATGTAAQPIEFKSAAALRDWFDRHAATAPELWVGYWKKGSGHPSVTYPEAVDEALCVGWIDGLRKGIDATRFAQRFTPRRKRSIWSLVNLRKVEQLTAEGRMRPAGLAAFEARDPARSGYSFEQADIAFEPGHERRLRADAAAWAFWEAQPPSYRNPAIYWVTSAKQAETRERRFAQLLADSAAGLRVAPLRRADRR